MAYEMHMGDDGILRVTFSGDFDGDDAEAYMADFNPILEAVPETKRIHFLVDVREVGKATPAARQVFREMFRDPDPRTGYTALVGASRYVRVVTGFVLKVTGAKNLRMFDSEEEALTWLKGMD